MRRSPLPHAANYLLGHSEIAQAFVDGRFERPASKN